MREYLFRGKRVDNGEWVEGMPCSDLKGGVDAIQSNLGGGIFDIYPESCGQYTDMKEFVVSDRAFNKPLFEGDIVEVWSTRRPCYSNPKSQYDGDVKVRAVICFTRGAWTLDYNNNYNKSLTKLKGKEEDERTVDGYWELYSFGCHGNEEWQREHNAHWKWGNIVKIGTVFENAELLEG